MRSAPNSLHYNIDTLLWMVAVGGWIIFALYLVILLSRTLARRGPAVALIQVVSLPVVLPLLLVLGLTSLSMAVVFIEPQEVGVVVSVPSPGGIRPQPLRAGLNWIIPLLEQEVRYPIAWQTYTMSGKPVEGAVGGDDAIRARTSDGQEVRLDSSIIFRLDIGQIVSVHVDWQNRYIEDLVRPVVRSVVRTQVSQFTVAEVNSSARKDLETTLDRILREELGTKGLIVDRFWLRDITFSPEYAAAVESKQVALEGQQEAHYRAEQIRKLAAGEADAIEATARARANGLKFIAEALQEDPRLLTFYYIEKLAPNVRAMLVPNNNPLILPLPDLVESSAVTATLAPTGTLPLDPTTILPTAPTERP